MQRKSGIEQRENESYPGERTFLDPFCNEEIHSKHCAKVLATRPSRMISSSWSLGRLFGALKGSPFRFATVLPTTHLSEIKYP